MTKKDYEAIARVFQGQRIIGTPVTCENRHEFTRGAREQAENYVNGIAEVFAADNPRFNRARFLKACGVQS